MATSATQTVRDIITDALLDIEAATMGQSAAAVSADHAMRALNRVMKSWQLEEGTPAFLKATLTPALTTAISYTLTPPRPIRILSCRFKQNGIETPMTLLTRDEYDNLPQKTATGTPSCYYYDRQRENALLYIWPGLASATTETLVITYEREFEDIAGLNDTIDLPAEWYDVAVKQLAARLVNAYGSENAKARLPIEAREALMKALGAGVHGESVYFTSA